ncbi:MAG: hypothetical protein ABSH51_18365 [Solirubrobacteraceae bacterium]
MITRGSRFGLVALVLAAATFGPSTAARAATGEPVYVAADCGGQGGFLGGHVIRPRTVYLVCGGTLMLFFTGVTYSSYGGATASGRGVVFYTGCSAACAKSSRHEPGTFTLSDVKQCSDGRLYYTHAQARAPGVPDFVSDITPETGIAGGLSCTTPHGTTSPGPPAPASGQTVLLTLVSGVVTFRLPGTATFRSLTGAVLVPAGTEVDAIDGRVLVTVSAGTSAPQQSATVYGGQFLVRQDASPPYETHFVLSEPLTGCPGVAAEVDHEPIAALRSRTGLVVTRRKPTRRDLWVTDTGGSFGTTGSYVSTTTEGTQWLTQDTCGTSSVQVVEGIVAVLDLVDGQTIVLHADQRYTAARHERPAGPLTVVDSYWFAIDAHDFARAYGYVLPGLIGSEGAFANSEAQEGIESVAFSGRVSRLSGATATVGVTSLVTHDHEFGCRTWSGTYGMVRRAAGWLIASADITPAPCRT